MTPSRSIVSQTKSRGGGTKVITDDTRDAVGNVTCPMCLTPCLAPAEDRPYGVRKYESGVDLSVKVGWVCPTCGKCGYTWKWRRA